MLTTTITVAMWAFLRTLDEEEARPRFWSFVLAASVGTSLLLKSTIGLLFPAAAGVIYLLFTRQLYCTSTWKRLHPFSGLLIVLLIAAPRHILATLRNPPYFDFTLHSRPGEYHGFLWFFFLNEQVFRFLNLRYPRDYNTVPRLYFWLLHFIWLFPWSVYFPAIAKLSFQPIHRAGRTRLLALCWTSFLLVFFTFSTTQEYYSMPCYPALALLLGSAMAMGADWVRRGTEVLSGIAGCAALLALIVALLVWNDPVLGDISTALTQHPEAYTLALGHLGDLTLHSFVYLRFPLIVASFAFLVGAVGTCRPAGQRAFITAALMMVLFLHAARMALVVFDPYLSSRRLAEALLLAPAGQLVVDDQYYAFSSVFFYTNRSALLLNGRVTNLEYGSYAPGAAQVFINDSQFKDHWLTPVRYYLIADHSALPRFESLVGREALNVVVDSGGKLLLANYPTAMQRKGGPDRRQAGPYRSYVDSSGRAGLWRDELDHSFPAGDSGSVYSSREAARKTAMIHSDNVN